jgi:serine/threonine protein kinase
MHWKTTGSRFTVRRSRNPWQPGVTLPWSAAQEASLQEEDESSEDELELLEERRAAKKAVAPSEENWRGKASGGDDSSSSSDGVEEDSSSDGSSSSGGYQHGEAEDDEVAADHCFLRLSNRYLYGEKIAFNVREARDTRTGLDVVVKVEPYLGTRQRCAPPKGVRVLMHLGRLPPGHPLRPHLPQLVDWSSMGGSDGRYAVVTRRVPCVDRDDLLPVLFKDPDSMREYLRQLVEAVRDLHAAGVIHRDLKPGNVLWVEEERRLVLIDFTLSTFVRPRGLKHTRYIGTRAYKCPEMEDDEEYDLRCDHHSLGVIFGQMAHRTVDYDVEKTEVRRWRENPPAKRGVAAPHAARSKGAPRRRPNASAMRARRNAARCAHLHDLFERLTARDPGERISLDEVLAHPYFST